MVDTMSYYHSDAHESNEAIYDEWGFHDSKDVSIDFLFPNGIYIQLDVPRNATIKHVKDILWRTAVTYPLFNMLAERNQYIFNYVNNCGGMDNITDENKHITEYDLFEECPLMKLVPCKGDIEQQNVVNEIKKLARPDGMLNMKFDEEIDCFRRDMRKEAESISKQRDNLHWKEFMVQHYPPTKVPFTQQYSVRDLGVIYINNENLKQPIYSQINPDWSVTELTKDALQKVLMEVALPSANPDDYVLHAEGKEYIVGEETPIYCFKYLRDALLVKNDDTAFKSSKKGGNPPEVSLVHVATVRCFINQNSHSFFEHKSSETPEVPPKTGRKFYTSWNVNHSLAMQVSKVRCRSKWGRDSKKPKELFVHIGVYNGTEALCETCFTREPSVKSDNENGCDYTWDEKAGKLSFPMNLTDLPRSAKMCLTLCSINKNKLIKAASSKGNVWKSIVTNGNPIAWINTPLFDHRGFLKTGKKKFLLWEWSVDQDADSKYLFPQGPVLQNSDDENAIAIEILFPQPFNAAIPVQYPSEDKILEEAARLAEKENLTSNSSKFHDFQLTEILKKDRFTKLNDEESRLLWQLRLECMERYPESLPKVLSVVNWSDNKEVAMVHSLITAWPNIEPDRAMELLNVHYADLKVRQFAIRCFEQLTDVSLQNYMLQLVQALKFELYLDNALCKFLIFRAWQNRKIGHYLFWHLKAEVCNKSSLVMRARYCVMIEAYLYGNIPHLHQLHRQNEAFIKMKSLNERVKDPSIGIKEIKTKARAALKETAAQYVEALSKVECPLDPNIDLKELVIDDCKVMNSKMRPLWLVFKQSYRDKKISIIYKNGDDLRQDMLTLQILTIMDQIWKEEGLDMKMIPYKCLATGSDSGLIEVVSPANTIANIQKERSGGAVNSSFRYKSLLEWITDMAVKHDISRQEAIDNFTYSCAGYCVATYVLGIGDRHSDNIMVTEKGHLFHIDFGHILGNFKYKLKIKRERVPFVLTQDFINVINKGEINVKEDFNKFKDLCLRLYLLLRSKGHLFITLFALMLESGLPELTSVKNLEFLRDTLCLNEEEKKARSSFLKDFNHAITNAWTVSMNWNIHNMVRDNS